MKKHISFAGIVVGLSVLITSTVSMATPIAVRNEGIDYYVKGKDLSWLGVGAYYGKVEREIEFNNKTPIPGLEDVLDADRGYAYVSFTPVGFFTLYGLVGNSESRIVEGKTKTKRSGEADYGVGIQFGFLNHFIKEPVPFENRFRVNLAVEHIWSQTDRKGRSLDWDKTDVAVTFGIVNDTTANKYFAPESIALYLGGIYSTISGDGFKEAKETGGIGGVEIFFTDSFSIDAKAYIFDKTSFDAGFNIHF